MEAEFHEHVDSSHQLRHLQLENRELKKQLAALVEQSPGGSKKRSADENNRRRVVERETMPVRNTLLSGFVCVTSANKLIYETCTPLSSYV